MQDNRFLTSLSFFIFGLFFGLSFVDSLMSDGKIKVKYGYKSSRQSSPVQIAVTLQLFPNFKVLKNVLKLAMMKSIPKRK